MAQHPVELMKLHRWSRAISKVGHPIDDPQQAPREPVPLVAMVCFDGPSGVSYCPAVIEEADDAGALGSEFPSRSRAVFAVSVVSEWIVFSASAIAC